MPSSGILQPAKLSLFKPPPDVISLVNALKSFFTILNNNELAYSLRVI